MQSIPVMTNRLLTGVFLVVMLVLASCSSDGGFHLRGSQELPEVYKRIYLQGHGSQEDFALSLRRALEQAGSELVDDTSQASAILNISDYEENKRVAGYGANREVREYLIFLRFSYSTRLPDGKELLPQRKVNLDKIQIYDSAFVLGKIEEERLIKEDLRRDAARQIVLRLRYARMP